MFFLNRRAARPLLLLFAFSLLGSRPAAAGLRGPTVQFDYGAGHPVTNALGKFMYFIPLISPDGISVRTNAGNSQCARVTSFRCRTNSTTFQAVCEFDLLGDGQQRNVFDHGALIERQLPELESGKTLTRQLEAIVVQGAGSGTVEIDGLYTNGQAAVSEMRMRFNSRGRTSPVSVILKDISMRDGKLCYANETVARVNSLIFWQHTPPQMGVTLASVKRAGAGDGLWENLVGDLKGAAANLLLPPLSITAGGQQAMLEFGLALAMEKPAFTFPFAERLKNGPVIEN
jgi:hypothetical protein